MLTITGVSTLTGPIPAPVVSISALTQTSASVNWTAPIPTGQSVIAGYRVYRATASGGPYTLSATVSAATLTFGETGLSIATQYFWQVEPYDQFGLGNRNAPVSGTTLTAGGSAIGYPKLACTYIAGTFSLYNNPAVTTYFAHMDDFIYNFPEGQQASNGFSAAQFCNTAVNGSVRPGGTLPFSYYDPMFQNPGAALNQMRTAHQLLYVQYPSNLTEAQFGGAPCGNSAIAGSQPTSTIGGVTRTPSQFMGDFVCDMSIDGGSRGLLQGALCAPNPKANVVLDDFFLYNSVSGDWLRNNTTQPAEQGLTPPGSGPASQALRDGWAALVARIRSNHPSVVVIANMGSTYYGGASTSRTGIVGVFDGGDMEASLGWQFSEDVGGGGWVSGMQTVQRAIALCKQPHHVHLNHINLTSDGRDFYRTAPYQALLYGLCSSLLVGAYYMPSPTGNNPNNVLTNAKGNNGLINNLTYTGGALWFDEFAVNPSTLIAYAYGAAGIATGAYWMGQLANPAFDAVANAYQGTVHRNLYTMANGRTVHILVNASLSASQVVTLPVDVFAITGTQNPANNGAKIAANTSFTMGPMTGRILVQ